MFIHIPLWMSFRNEERKRLYLRIEVKSARPWGSGGRNKDGSLKIYRRGFQIRTDFTICHGKVNYSLTYSEY